MAGLCAALRTSRPSADVELLRRAYDVAARCHQGQIRLSGDLYITHPVKVATILAGLGAEDQVLCAGIEHDVLEGTPYTFSELRRGFGTAIATMVAEHTALGQIGRQQARTVSQAMAAIRSTDTRVAVMRVADRLHNMRTLRFLPKATQLDKAREVVDIFAPAARQLSMDSIGSELETLAFAALANQPARWRCRRAIIAPDIERSTSRPDRVKAGLHGPDRAAEALLVTQVVPALDRYLISYNASLPPQRQLRVRVVVHEGMSTTTPTDASAGRWM
jgi:(p)ppGpp synthase/HD superfamily hydrolase